MERPCWTTPGGACEDGETIEQTARREVAEETGMTDLKLGPIVWYGEDAHRSGDWNVVFKEHFIVAYASTETLDQSGWTEHERGQILECRWWTVADIRRSTETIYPFGLANLLDPSWPETFRRRPLICHLFQLRTAQRRLRPPRALDNE